MTKFQDLTGKKFGKLTVLKLHHKKNNGKTYLKYWLCKCDCGNTKLVEGGHLRSNKIKSCGCLVSHALIKRNYKHGLTNTRLFHIWLGIKDRCLNKKSSKYKYYGLRGITIFQEWLNNFTNFYNWAINNGYAENLTIDRIDVNGNYEPDNCRWITQEEQCRNKQNTVYITYKGETHLLSEWSKITGINYNTLSTRFYRDKKRGEELFKNV